MKFVHKSKQAQALLLQQLLYLRYQTTQPNKTNRPKPVLPLSTISAMLKVPVNTLTWMHRRYFNQKETRLVKAKQTPTLNLRPEGQTPVTFSNLQNDEIQFITSQHNQHIWATESIQSRCKLFHRTFPNRRISKGIMLKIMKNAGLKKKKIQVQNIPAKIELRQQEFRNSTLLLDNRIHEILKEECHFIFLDECIFKSRDFQRQAWSAPLQNLKVFDMTQNQPCQAVCIAICKCHGVLAQVQVDYALTIETFKQMLDNISGALKDEKTYLFMDNASFHRNEEVRKHMEELNIKPIFNVAYRFEFNPCERLFGQYKSYYRKALLRKMLETPAYKSNPLKDALFETFCDKAKETKLSIPKFIKKALGIIRREANEIRIENEEEELKDIV